MIQHHRAAGTAHAKRPDIQGLRALAVLVVVANHLTSWPAGGFVGVDVFFVVSGFLITDLLLRERERTGRISYLAFYRRRIRRIIPVALCVLLVVVAASYYVYRPIRARMIRDDAFWSLVFLANRHFADAQTDYFHNEGLVSPLQHFWSLAVEEQFYVVWPVIVIAGAALVAGRARSPRPALAVALTAAAATSFGYAFWQSANEPARAYFSTVSRIWELAAGALLAVALPQLTRLPRRVRPALAGLGLAAILGAVVGLSATSTFPAPWGLLPVLGTAAVLAAGSNGGSTSTGGVGAQGLVVLTNPVAGYLGDLSYSLYLWHFPVITLIAAYEPQDSSARLAATVVLLALLGVASYHLIEVPVRRSTLLEPRRLRPERVRVRDAFTATLVRRTGYGALVAVVLANLGLGAHIASTWTHPAAGAAEITPAALDQKHPTGPAGELADRIDAALAAERFPDLSPGVDNLPANRAPQWTDCGTTGAWNATRCVYGPPSAGRTMAVIGDSIALSWLPGVIQAAQQHDVRVHSFVAGECPAAAVHIAAGSAQRNCDSHRRWALSAIAALHPDLIVLSDSSFMATKLTDHATGAAATHEWQAGATQTLRALRAVAPTVVLSSPPGTKSLIDCATVRATPAACAGTTDRAEVAVLHDASTAAAATAGARYVDTTAWFCAADGRCPSFVGTTPVYVDGTHLSRQYSQGLAALLARALRL